MSASHSSREGYAPYREHRTWYRITGNPASDKTPLVIAHGGPGCTHDYLLAFQDLADDGLHPNAAGFRVMAPLAEAAIGKALAAAP